MSQREDQDLILGYVEGELSPDDRTQLDALMAKDQELRQLVEGLVDDRRALRQLPMDEPPPGLADNALQRLERQLLFGKVPAHVPDSQARRFRFYKTLTYSGIAALILISAGVVITTLTDDSLLERLNQLQVPASGPRLADGQAEAPRADTSKLAMAKTSGQIDLSQSPDLRREPMATTHSDVAADSGPRPAEPVDLKLAAAVGTVPDQGAASAPTMQIALAEKEAALPDLRAAGAMKRLIVAERSGAVANADRAEPGRFTGFAEVTKGIRARARVALMNEQAPRRAASTSVKPLVTDPVLPVAAFADRPRIEITTDDAVATRQSLMAWAAIKQAKVKVLVPTIPKTPENANEVPIAVFPSDLTIRRESANEPVNQDESAAHVMIQLRRDQVPLLLNYLNESRGYSQHARVVDKPILAAGQASSPGRGDGAAPRTTDALGSLMANPKAPIDTFDWGRVLETQLPLARSTPIHVPDQSQLLLSVRITESATRIRSAEPAETQSERSP